MRTLLLLAMATRASATASSGCSCLTSYPSGVDPSAVAIGGVSYSYPATYGLSTCSQHDTGLEPSCAGSTNVPAWCADTWCYVDKDACNVPVVASSYFPGSTLYFSYGTCGSTNTFTVWFINADSGSGDAGISQTVRESASRL